LSRNAQHQQTTPGLRHCAQNDAGRRDDCAGGQRITNPLQGLARDSGGHCRPNGSGWWRSQTSSPSPGGPPRVGQRAPETVCTSNISSTLGELQRRGRVAGAELDDSDTTLELVLVRRDRCATKGGCLADLGQAHEGEPTMESQSACIARDRRDRLAVSRRSTRSSRPMPELRTNRFPWCQRGECGMASPVPHGLSPPGG
jgi:hypothetical protein